MKGVFVMCVLVASVVGCFSLDREAFTFTKYELEVQIEPKQQRLAVRGTITLRNDSSTPQKNATLQISSSLTWRSIQAEGKPLQFVSQPYVSDIDHSGELSEAIVALPKEVPPGGTVELAIGYEGVIVLDATRFARIGLPKDAALHSDWDQISALSSAVRGVGNVAWYPVSTEAANLSEGNSLFETLGRWKQRELKAEMKIQIDYLGTGGQARPAFWCNGKNVRLTAGTSPAESARTECLFARLGLDVPTFVLADYQILDRPMVQIAYRPEHKSNAEKFAQAGEAVTPFITEWFGALSEKAQVAELMDPAASPFESGAMLLTPLDDADPKLLQIALVHELTHAAYSSNRQWIYEGLAHFSQALYRERQENRQAAVDFMGLHRSAVVVAEKAVAARPKDAPEESLITTTVEEFYRSKAAYVWWMLRDMIGEDALKKALASYRPEQDNDPSYLQRLVEVQSKRDLQWFFDDWVYHDRDLPDFRVETAFSRKSSQDNYLVTVTVENLGSAGAEVPVIVRFDGGELTDRVQVRAKAKGVIRVSTPKPPTQIIVNDGSVPESDMSNNVFKIETPKI
ncbi:MAG: hypothetical protein WA628_16875 [Terriglobales bacterium]